jgi:hypothetical protein
VRQKCEDTAKDRCVGDLTALLKKPLKINGSAYGNRTRLFVRIRFIDYQRLTQTEVFRLLGKAGVEIGRLKRRFYVTNAMFFRLIKHNTNPIRNQHFPYTFADVFADSSHSLDATRK